MPSAKHGTRKVHLTTTYWPLFTGGVTPVGCQRESCNASEPMGNNERYILWVCTFLWVYFCARNLDKVTEAFVETRVSVRSHTATIAACAVLPRAISRQRTKRCCCYSSFGLYERSLICLYTQVPITVPRDIQRSGGFYQSPASCTSHLPVRIC